MVRRILWAEIFFLLSLIFLPWGRAEIEFQHFQSVEETPFHAPPSKVTVFQKRVDSPTEKSSSFISPREETAGIETSSLGDQEDLVERLSLQFLASDRKPSEFGFDIPIVINARVEQFIQIFQTTFRERFVTWLGRSQKYIPMMRDIFRSHGLPEDLVYIVFIESGFDPYAYSRSKASGPWQFVYWTGKKYGLKVNWWIDERRDPEKSTLAAAKYLRDLYARFECWHLAAAGYNAGEYRIIRAMRRYRGADFWKLAESHYLKRETKNYVPQIIAATLIAKDPKRYGFAEVEYQEPLRFEKVRVPELTGLSLIAKACQTSVEEIKGLNPELRRGVTPPNEEAYEIKIPFGKGETFATNFEALRPLERFKFKTHSVRSGETLAGIARDYRVDLEALLELNHLRGASRLSRGTMLLVPLLKDEEIEPFVIARRKNGKAQNTSKTGRT